MPSISRTRSSYSESNRPMEATMIQASTVNLQDSHVTMTNTQVIEPGRALESLRSYCSLSAVVDAKERYDPPRCADATRQDIIQKIEDWVCHDDPHIAPSSMFWLHGGAGAGKSALAQTVAEKCKTNEELAASFFFFKADLNRNDGDRLIPTLVHQLVQTFQGLPPFVERSILQHTDLFEKTRKTQMLELVIKPLISLSLKETDGVQSNAVLKSHPRLVVIDGLDECSNADTQCDLLQIIASAIPRFPYPLRFLITSRPELHIIHTFHHDVGEVAQYDLSADSDADKDIQHFLEGEFAKIRCTHPLRQHLPSQWPPRGSVSSIVEQSSSHFIYASTVIRFIQSPKHSPDDQLLVVMGLKRPYEKDRPYARLDSLYTSIFLGIQNPGQLHRALGVIYLRSLKSGLFSLSRYTSNRRAIEALLNLRREDLFLIFNGLLSLVYFDEGDIIKGDIRIFHKSLFEYLLDPSRSGELQLDLGLAHENAANYIVSGKQPEDAWDSAEFQQFAYHCQFARLNDVLTSHLRSLACCDSKIIFNDPLSKLLVPSKQFSLLQSILYFLQVMGRQDFDSTGHCYQTYVPKMVQYLRSSVPWGQRIKNKIPGLLPDALSKFKGRLRSLLQVSHELFSLKGLTRTPIPLGTNTNVAKTIEREHDIFSSYVEARYGQPNIPVSFLESSAEFIHSCHFVGRPQSASMAYLVTFVMLVTYSQCGVRLSCTEFDDITSIGTQYLVKQHLQRTQNEVYNDHITVYS